MSQERKRQTDSETPKKPDEEPSQEQRIEKLQERIAELSGKAMMFEGDAELDPDIQEAFLENVVAMEEAGFSAPAEKLKEGGLALPPASELDDQAVHDKLWEIVHAMALRNMFVTSTDHLSDRELYVRLMENLEEESFMGPAVPRRGFNFVIDLVSSGSDEDNELYLKYYADEQTREQWTEDFPDMEIPERVQPPYDRDRLLPQPDWTPPDWDDEEPVM
jgi:hypothetical protein